MRKSTGQCWVGGGGVRCGGGQGRWCCAVYGRYLKGAVVRSISCNAPLKVVGYKCIRWKSVQLCYCSRKEAVFVVVMGGGYLSVFIWVIGICLAVSGLEVLIGHVILFILESLASAIHCSRVGQERAEANVDADTTLLPSAGPL